MSSFRASSKIEEYGDHKKANEGIEAEEIRGWTAQSITAHREGWGEFSDEHVLVLYRASEPLPRAELLNIAMNSRDGRSNSPGRVAMDVLLEPSSDPLPAEILIELMHSNSGEVRVQARKIVFSRDQPVLTRAQAIELTKSEDHTVAEAAAQWLLEDGSWRRPE